MKSSDFLVERVVNLFTKDQKEKYVATVWDILQRSYSKLPGGFATAASPEELIEKSTLWKVVTRGGDVSAVRIYRDQFGKKSIASGTNGTIQGKKDFLMLNSADVHLGRSWSEVSGAPEALMKKAGAKPIPAKYAPMLTGKDIIEYNPDGIHYTRMIAGEPHEKAMYGMIHLTPALADQLTAAGIELHKLPHSIK